MPGRYLEIAIYRAGAELKRDVARAYLGTIWWFLEPILYMAVFYLVFGLGMRRGGTDFVVYLLTGLVVWKWLDGSVRASSSIILGSVGLMQQVYLPKMILPAVVVLMNTFKFAVVFAVFLVFLLFGWRLAATLHWFALVPLMLVQLIFICAVSSLVASLVPLVPDFKYLVDFGMTLLFFVSGIFFDVHDLTPEIQDILRYNPMIFFIDAYREILLYGKWPVWSLLGKVCLLSVLLLSVSLALLHKLDRYYPRVVG